MKGNFKLLVSDTIIKFSLLVSCVLILLQVIIVVFFIGKNPPYVPFFNSQPWGEERLVNSEIIPLLPAILFFVFLLNNICSGILYKKHTLVARMLSVNSLLFVVLGFLAYIQILFLIY